jgi:uncharacterized protein (DUF1778 family)
MFMALIHHKKLQLNIKGFIVRAAPANASAVVQEARVMLAHCVLVQD